MVVEQHIDADIYSAVMQASRAAYRRVAELVGPRITANLVAAAGQVISDAEWEAMLGDVSDAYGDAYLDAVIAAGISLGVLPADAEIIARLERQEESVSDLAASIRELLDLFLDNSVREGIAADEIRRRLLDAPSSPLNPRKADTFARTATNASVNAGFSSAFKAAGVPAVSWITRRDDRVRDAHGAVDRDVVPNGVPFLVGGYEARFPGDPALPIELRINCRCMLGWVDGDQVRRAVDATTAELRRTARNLNIAGRSTMRKPQLQLAVIQNLCLQGLAAGPDCPDILDEMNMATLLVHARAVDVRGRYRMRRPQLVDAVKTAYTDVDLPPWLPAEGSALVDTQSLAYDPSQPRHPSGSVVGGRWRSNYDNAGRPVRHFEVDAPLPVFDRPGSAAWHEERDRLASYETERQVVESASREQLDRYRDLHGRGVDALFPEGAAETTVVPFPAASRLKGEQLYDRQVVIDRLAQPVRLSNFDPRTLHATQSGITKPGVNYYMGTKYQSEGLTYADRDAPGNRYPIIYRNPRSNQLMLLSGHHRATAALLTGRQLKGIYIDPRIRVITTRNTDLEEDLG